MKDSPRRTIMKTFSYVTTHYIIQFIVVYLFTQNLGLALAIIGVEMVIETIYFYLHERIWEKDLKSLIRQRFKAKKRQVY
jgi:uncharacterized membrane protein